MTTDPDAGQGRGPGPDESRRPASRPPTTGTAATAAEPPSPANAMQRGLDLLRGLQVFRGLTLLRGYQRGWLRGDLLAGITVAAYLVPQVMAYSAVAGLPAVAGLWAICGSLGVYFFLGSSRQLSVGPESTTALMTAVAVGPIAAGDPGRYAALAAALGLLVGLLCVVGWVGRLGFLADLLSKPVLVGYLAGMAAIMISSQLDQVTKVEVDGDTFFHEVASFAGNASQAHLPTLALAAAVLTFLLVGSRLAPRAPAPLIGMLLAAAAVAIFSLENHGIALVGEIPGGLPTPAVPDVVPADLVALLVPALGVTVVAYTDNVLTGRAFATRNGYDIDANQELLALGGANAAAGALQGFPVSSSGSRTVIADSLGGRSQVYSLVALSMVVATLLLLRPVLATFPEAALGAIVVYAALRLIQIGEFRRIARFRHSEIILALATTLSVLGLGVLNGVLVAVALSILDLLRRVARPHDGILGYAPGVPGMHDLDDYPDARPVPGLVVYRYDSPLFFANAEDFKRRALAAVDEAEAPVEWFLLNAEANIEVDITSTDVLDELREELQRREIVFALARVKQDLHQDLDAAGLIDKIGDDRIFMTLPTAVHAYVDWYVERHGDPPREVILRPPPTNPVIADGAADEHAATVRRSSRPTADKRGRNARRSGSTEK